MQYGTFLRLHSGRGSKATDGPLVGPFRSDSVRNSMAFTLGVPAGERDEVSVLAQWGSGADARWVFVEDFLTKYDHLIETETRGELRGVRWDQLRDAVRLPGDLNAPVPTYAQANVVPSLYAVVPAPRYATGGPCEHCGGSGRVKYVAEDGRFALVWRYQDGSETSPERFATLTSARAHVNKSNNKDRTPFEIIGPDGRVYG